MVPKRFHKKTKKRLAAANDSALTIGGKVEASVVAGKFALKNLFILAKDLHSMVILGTPFINLITPYKVNEQGICFKARNEKQVFPFVEKPKKRNLNLIKAHSIYEYRINALIKVKQTHLMHLQQDVKFQRIQEQLQTDLIKSKISDFKKQIEDEICSDLPNAFWDRKQHIVDLPYKNNFDEKKNCIERF